MSGIAAIFETRGGIVDPVLLGRMTAVVAHRGPDGSEIWTDGEVGLGHRRLGGRDSTGVTTDSTGTLRSIFDGRIDNRDEIRRMLAAESVAAEQADD
jgi:asparagine synthase (glutamine-hydrolysing)